MRFTSMIVAGAFAVLAAAQSADTTTAAPPTSVALTPVQSSQAACLKACKDGDVDCQSHCITVPAPNDAQANATTECVAKCPQGKGTEADTNKYATCVQGCIETHYYETKSGTPRATGAAGSKGDSGKDDSGSSDKATKTGSAPDSTSTDSESGSDSGSDADSTKTDSGSGSDSTGTATGSAAASTSTDSAASAIAIGSVSILGLVAAVFAL